MWHLFRVICCAIRNAQRLFDGGACSHIIMTRGTLRPFVPFEALGYLLHSGLSLRL